ncbi:MAG: A/G-specific adenine glycosylase [Betaproteobacteria bacterium]|nr:A/G-specific adenine glycosylase [Betaproteobacteria bacterium]
MRWQADFGRHDLPWQDTRDPYRIWVSEIMLQQTQVATVIPYYQRFMERFPDVLALARADENEVLQYWSGLGYYARARHLHRAARQVASVGGHFPETAETLQQLPGVGRSTAAAIAAFAYGQRQAILDGNVKRVLARVFAIAGNLAQAAVTARLWALAESLLPARNIEAYTQGLMDIGATCCVLRNPRCQSCPLQELCEACRQGAVQDYPAPRAARPVPEKSFQMLVVAHQGRLLLEKRPSQGIWGGLWSFPEAAEGEDPAKILKERWGLEGRPWATLPPLRHALTHFRLRIYPVCLAVNQGSVVTEGPGLQWVETAAVPMAAVPMPVRKLMKLLGEFAVDNPDGVL